MAVTVATVRERLRRALARVGVALISLSVGLIPPSMAQTPAPERLLALAHSAAALQGGAAELAASRDTRPEVRSFAQRMVDYRRIQIPRLENAAKERVKVPSSLELEHQSILENLQPLQALELSRRYAEVQVQALEQELQIYAAAESSTVPWLKQLANEARSELEPLLQEARRLKHAVGT